MEMFVANDESELNRISKTNARKLGQIGAPARYRTIRFNCIGLVVFMALHWPSFDLADLLQLLCHGICWRCHANESNRMELNHTQMYGMGSVCLQVFDCIYGATYGFPVGITCEREYHLILIILLVLVAEEMGLCCQVQAKSGKHNVSSC